MLFHKSHIILTCFILLITGGAAAQQIHVEPRIAGLEQNETYMNLLQEDAKLQIREDSIVNAVQVARQRLREDPANRQQYSQQILSLEGEIFNVRNAKGRLVDKINTIEQEWVLASLSNDNQQTTAPVSQEKPAVRIPDSLKTRNLIYNSYFSQQLPQTDYVHLKQAQALELDAVDYVNRYFANYNTLAELAASYEAAKDETEAAEIFDNYNTINGFNRVLTDSLSGAWNFIADNKGYAYGYLMDKLDQEAILTQEEEQLSEAARELSALRGLTASDAVADYFLRKKVLLDYETSVASILGLGAARDSLRGVASQLANIDFKLPKLDVKQRYFLDYDSVAFYSIPKYNYQHPIPACKIYEHGTIYRILVGTFASKRPVSTFRGAYPIGYLINEDKKWCYYAGGFATLEEAEEAQKLLKQKGFAKPEIVQWVDGVSRNLTVEAATQKIVFRVEIEGVENLSDPVKAAITVAAEGRELSRVGTQLYAVGVFEDRDTADKLAAVITQADPSLKIKVAEIVE